MFKVERAKSLAEAVTARLREEIVEGEFGLGEALSEAMIAARYQVSRTPVREAFAFLGLEGLVRTEAQQGTFVFTMNRDEFDLMSETRAILETAALRLANERNRARLVKNWKRIVASMDTALKNGDAKRYSKCDGDFHQILFSLAANPFLGAANQSFVSKMAAVRNRLGAQPDHMKHSYKQHVELLRLLEEDDIEAAVKLLEHHIRFKGEAFWTAADMTKSIGASSREGRSRAGLSVR